MNPIVKLLVEANRALTVFSYPVGFVFVPTPAASTASNARLFYLTVFAVWLPGTCYLHNKLQLANLALPWLAACHVLLFYAWDAPLIAFFTCSFLTERVLRRQKCTNRLFNKASGEKPQFKGKKIVILGNGPSLAQGSPQGKRIDDMDEVVRFNNFQTKVSGLEQWTGTKTTVHFSDSMLFPSYPEYVVPGACVCLSLFMDRLVVSGSYFLFRIFIDLAPRESVKMMFDSSLGWLLHEDIANVIERVGISKWKHPTSGCLAIDWFVQNRPDKSVPVYIHGFDFFQGGQIHYYSRSEPLYERLNDLLGVTVMHQPWKEKAFVEQLVKEGKVEWLVDPKDRPKPEAKKADAPLTAGSRLWHGIVTVNRILTVLSYPIAAPFITSNFWPSTPDNATIFRRCLVCAWMLMSGVFYYNMWFNVGTWTLTGRAVAHFFWFWSVDVPIWWSGSGMYLCELVLRRKRCTNRLFSQDQAPEFHGPRIVVLGNGPSMGKGTPHGDLINGMDEVVRFNNFQAKDGSQGKFTGTKTTVHFSDSMLYPTYPEYEVPGACICLSLFMDRLMVSLSFFVIRMGLDLSPWQAWALMKSPALGWLQEEDIRNLSKELGISKWKHPTSGCLAIDWMVRNRPDKSIPVYIHGFDFFANVKNGEPIHYYHKQEPLYERVNNHLGVNLMHEPHKERAFVEKLVKEGKVKWLGDLAKESQ